MKSITLLAVCALLSSASIAAAAAMTEADCSALFTKLDVNKDGNLTESEATSYYAALKTPAVGGKLSQTQFMDECKAGNFSQVTTAATGTNTTGTTTTATTGAATTGASTTGTSNTNDMPPLTGANSFTEQQAKDRAVKAGFKDVSALTKDDKGIWRGTATASDGTANKNVAIDYKGNVVAN